MAEYMWLAVMAHLIADFPLQNKWMAVRKGNKDRNAYFICTFHVLIYTTVVMLFLGSRDPLVFAAVYIPHWIIDKWSLADKWAKLTKGRPIMESFNSKSPYRELEIAFMAVVYVVNDFLLHLLCLWAVIKLLILKG